jgi:hypothetical protein
LNTVLGLFTYAFLSLPDAMAARRSGTRSAGDRALTDWAVKPLRRVPGLQGSGHVYARAVVTAQLWLVATSVVVNHALPGGACCARADAPIELLGVPLILIVTVIIRPCFPGSTRHTACQFLNAMTFGISRRSAA